MSENIKTAVTITLPTSFSIGPLYILFINLNKLNIFNTEYNKVKLKKKILIFKFI